MPQPVRVALLLAAAMLALSCETAADTRPAPVLRIMPLGDSNTTGTVGGGYRTDLFQLLASEGPAPDFVGSNHGGPAWLPDRDHEGHGGWTIAQIAANAPAWLRTYRPDLVLLQIGTNDTRDATRAASAPARLAALLDTMLAVAPEVRILVATIPPIDDPVRQRRVETFNAAIPAIVAARERVSSVDVYDAVVQPRDFSDLVHLNGGGYSKIAVRWYAAITGRPTRRYEAERDDTARKDTNASAGLAVDASAAVFTVYAATPGTYRLHLRATGTCTYDVAGTSVRIATTSRGQWSTARVDVPLTAGTTTLRFTGRNCTGAVDALDVPAEPVS